MEDENVHPQSYFTREVEAKMADLTDEDMLRSLRNLEQSEYWIAILRYNQQRLRQSQSAIFVADPVKDPTNISRHQGIMLGLSDLQNAVVMLVQEAERTSREKESVSKEQKKK